ncbi:UNVERIFIED_CONTAM: Magnesium transporter MRS2-4 [Sesamum radiatum]|uniref:Magnesium transporter MRS2-4 n=1 Tax=Sesamum radiatum TaxID=300843 RepID=A0AAW2JPG7_SESRA
MRLYPQVLHQIALFLLQRITIGTCCEVLNSIDILFVLHVLNLRLRHEYIDDTKDYVNIQLDNRRNELIQLQLTMTIPSFAITIETLTAGIFGMNIPCTLYSVNGIFKRVVGS